MCCALYTDEQKKDNGQQSYRRSKAITIKSKGYFCSWMIPCIAASIKCMESVPGRKIKDHIRKKILGCV